MMASKGCLSVTKYFLFIFNLFFFILGGILLGFGLWILFDKSSFISALGSRTLSMKVWSYFFSGVGTFTMMMGFLGCLGALKELKCMLGFYFFFLILLFAAQITLGVLMYTQLGAIRATLGEYVEELIRNYGDSDKQVDANESWDILQKQLQCCGWQSKEDWKENKVVKTNSTVKYPCSCLNETIISSENYMEMYNGTSKSPEESTPPPRIFCNAESNEVWEKGCMNTAETWLKDNITNIVLVCLGIAVIELFGMILSMFLCRNLDQNYDKLARYH